MNQSHELCGSDEWRAVVRDSILPWAIGQVELGDDVLEVGPGYGATTDVLGESASHLTAVEIDPELAATLTEPFADNAAVVIVRGDATALESRTAASAVRRRSPCSTTSPPPNSRIVCSPRSGGF